MGARGRGRHRHKCAEPVARGPALHEQFLSAGQSIAKATVCGHGFEKEQPTSEWRVFEHAPSGAPTNWGENPGDLPKMGWQKLLFHFKSENSGMTTLWFGNLVGSPMTGTVVVPEPTTWTMFSSGALALSEQPLTCMFLPAIVGRCMTKTKEHRVSLRLNKDDYDDLTLGLKPDANLNAFCVPLLLAGARRQRFPGIDFREAGPRQVAWLAGTRWPVWMVMDLLDELNGDVAAAAKHMRQPAALVRVAAAYARAYADEIKAERTLASERSELAGLARVLPHIES